MPQIWVTYDELAGLFDCEPLTARAIVMRMKLDRRKSRDGNTRVKLSAALNEMFFTKLFGRWIDQELQACAGDLRALRENMAARGASTAAQVRHGRLSR
jgi:hypothetical protein